MINATNVTGKVIPAGYGVALIVTKESMTLRPATPQDSNILIIFTTLRDIEIDESVDIREIM